MKSLGMVLAEQSVARAAEAMAKRKRDREERILAVKATFDMAFKVIQRAIEKNIEPRDTRLTGVFISTSSSPSIRGSMRISNPEHELHSAWIENQERLRLHDLEGEIIYEPGDEEQSPHYVMRISPKLSARAVTGSSAVSRKGFGT